MKEFVYEVQQKDEFTETSEKVLTPVHPVLLTTNSNTQTLPKRDFNPMLTLTVYSNINGSIFNSI